MEKKKNIKKFPYAANIANFPLLLTPIVLA